MRTIPFQTIVNAVSDLCIKAACQLPADILSYYRILYIRKIFNRKEILSSALIMQISLPRSISICQDTGFAVFFVTMGAELAISGGTISQAINCGVEQGYKEGYLRNSIVSDPLFDRKNTETTPCSHLWKSYPVTNSP